MKRPISVLAAFFLLAGSAQATTLGFGSKGVNRAIPSTWGSNIAVAEAGIVDNLGLGWTPDVGLTWSATTATGVGWEFYNDAEWSAAQMDGFVSGAKFDLLFTPDAGYAVQVRSFVFDDYLGYKSGSKFTWQLFKDSASGALINSGTNISVTDGQDLLINTGMASPYAGPVLLRLIGVTGNDGQDESLDTVTFTQAAVSVPETVTLLPLASALIGLGLLGRTRFRTKP